MENVSRDNLIDQLAWMIGELKQRPKEAYFVVPEFYVAQIDEGWQKQVSKSMVARELRLQKNAKKRKEKKDNM